MPKIKTKNKLTSGIVTIIVLSICLCVTTFALVRSTLTVKDNLFHTGSIDINLNDGQPIIQEHEFIFEPGMTVKKDFFIENDSTWSVYYKIYFDQVSGGLADVLEVTIKDGNRILYSGTAAELTKANVVAADDILNMGEKKTLMVYFYYPDNKSNETQNLDLTFTMCADATQVKNNPNKLFD